MTNDIYYTALEIYDSQTGDEFNWEKYIEWSKLTQLKELVSLDGLLNGLVFELDFDSKHDWNYIVTDQNMVTVLFNSKKYVLEKLEYVSSF